LHLSHPKVLQFHRENRQEDIKNIENILKDSLFWVIFSAAIDFLSVHVIIGRMSETRLPLSHTT
jgi:hypothetical protein